MYFLPVNAVHPGIIKKSLICLQDSLKIFVHSSARFTETCILSVFIVSLSSTLPDGIGIIPYFPACLTSIFYHLAPKLMTNPGQPHLFFILKIKILCSGRPPFCEFIYKIFCHCRNKIAVISRLNRKNTTLSRIPVRSILIFFPKLSGLMHQIPFCYYLLKQVQQFILTSLTWSSVRANGDGVSFASTTR